MTSNPLPPIWTAYKTIRYSLKMSQKSFKAAHLVALLNHLDFIDKRGAESYYTIKQSKTELDDFTDLIDKPWAESYNAIKQSQTELDDLFVVALWATFERFIRDYLQLKAEKLKSVSPDTLAIPLYEHFHNEVESCSPDEILKMLKGTLSVDLLGYAIEIVKYRDWVVQGRNQPPAAQIEAKSTYDTLNEIINKLTHGSTNRHLR
ncbi:MAG: hypothetical protein ABFS56_00800 [Pseudomonadota bacterium]